MDATSLVFSGAQRSTGNIAIDALIAQLKTVKDSNGVQVWQFVGRVAGLPDYGHDPQTSASDLREDQSPGILIVEHEDDHISTAVQFVDATIREYVSLKCYMYAPGTNFGDQPDIQELRRNITKATLRALRPISKDNPGGWPNSEFPWWPEEPQTVKVDYKDNQSNIEPSFPIVPPWWVWRIDLRLMAWNDRQSINNGEMLYSYIGVVYTDNLVVLDDQAFTVANTQEWAYTNFLVAPVNGTFTYMIVEINPIITRTTTDVFTMIVNNSATGLVVSLPIDGHSATGTAGIHVSAGDFISTRVQAVDLDTLNAAISYVFIPD